MKRWKNIYIYAQKKKEKKEEKEKDNIPDDPSGITKNAPETHYGALGEMK